MEADASIIAQTHAPEVLFGMVPFEMMEDVGGVASSVEHWLLTYFAPNAGLCLVGIQVANPFPNNQSGMTRLRYNFFVFFLHFPPTRFR